jgi:hypothetical protein
MRISEVEVDHIALAQSALDYYAEMKAKYADNYGVVTSIENREGPLRMYMKRGSPEAVLQYLKGDDYLGAWRRNVGL